MKVVHACTYDRGGAANAARQIHRGLLAAGVDSTLVVGWKTIDDATVREVPGGLCRGSPSLAARIEYRLGRWFCPFGPKPWGPALLPGTALRFIERLRPDVVHLHWVAHGFLSIEQIGRIRAPVVWTMHDMWPLTPGYGTRLEAIAGLPSLAPFQPLMPGPPFHRLGRNVWQRKLRAWRDLDAVLVSPSEWLAEEARCSEVFRGRRVVTIPNPVALDVFRSGNRAALRREFALPADRPLVLFGSDAGAGFLKGGDFLAAALAKVGTRMGGPARRPLLVIFGTTDPEWARASGCEVVALGMIDSPARLASLYAACDVFACPSRGDNLPNTVLESLASGTPVVGFRVGGLPDLVEDGVNGFLATPFDTDELAEALIRTWTVESRDGSLGRAGRARAEERWSSARVSEQYRELYRERLSSSRPKSGQ